MNLPSAELWLHHSAGSGTDAAAVRDIQAFHQRPITLGGRGWSDIAYSFLIDDDPEADQDAFEGRGAGVVGGHTRDHNSISHAICVIGDFTSKLPRESTLELIVALVVHGHREGWWPPQFTGGHRDARLSDGSRPGTECPGDTLYAYIDTLNQRIQEALSMGLTAAQQDRLAEFLDGIDDFNTANPDKPTNTRGIGRYVAATIRSNANDDAAISAVEARVTALEKGVVVDLNDLAARVASKLKVVKT
jgi:hypothetical protein